MPQMQKIIILCLIVYTISFKCGHDLLANIKPKILDLGNSTNNNKTRKLDASTPYEPIRFYIDDTQIKSQVSSTISLTYIQEILEALKSAISMFESILKVQRSDSVFVSVPSPGIGLNVISDAVKTGVAADVIIFPLFNDDLPNGVEAAASAMYYLPNGRPYAGVVMLNKRNYDFQKNNAQDYLIMLLFHELTHVLVFSDKIITQFVGVTNPLTHKTINGVDRTFLSTPKVVETAKKYFGCSTLTGVELENQGGTGTANGHWESRVMLGDYMIGADYGETVISEITLALFEDSGWYKVNYYTGGLFRYGKNKGCAFLQEKCVQGDTEVISGNEFCLKTTVPFCLSGRTGRGICYLTTHTSIPTEYQYFSKPNMGGYEHADYCPVAYAKPDESYYYASNCRFGKLESFPNVLGQVIGDKSVCMMSSLTPKTGSGLDDYRNKMRSMCYPITCNTSSRTVTVTIGSSSIECAREGGKLTVEGYDGEVYCPDYNLVCTGTTFCTDPIQCLKLKSEPLSDTFTYDYVPNNDQNVEATKSGNSYIRLSLYCVLMLALGLL